MNKEKNRTKGKEKRNKKAHSKCINFLVEKQTSGKHIGITPYVMQIILHSRIRWRSYQLYQANPAPNTAAIAEVCFSLPRVEITQGADGRNVSSSDVRY